jgi:hypothetical protein
MRVAMKTYFVPVFHDHPDLIRKGLDRVPGDKPRGLDTDCPEKLEKSRCAYLSREYASGYVVG